MSQREDQIGNLFLEGAGRLLSRASDNHGLTAEMLASRIKSAVNKYILQDDPQASSQVIQDFIEKLGSVRWRGVTESPLRGPAGNKEFLVLLEKAT